MEYVDGTNLQQYLEANGGKLAEDVARFIFQVRQARLAHRHITIIAAAGSSSSSSGDASERWR
jgi:hypothetical protein